MSIVAERKQAYLELREDREKGIVKGIQLGHVFPKLASIIPVLPPGYQMLWTANSGVGKTQTWMGIFLYSLYKEKKLKLTNTKTILVITLLEDTKEMFIDRLYSMMFYELYKIRIDNFSLQSASQILPKEYIPLLDNVEKEIEFLLGDCEIIDNVYNPTGLYRWCRSISNKYGTHHNKMKEFIEEDETTHKKTVTTKEVYSHYETYEKNIQFLLIVDNLNNLQQESKNGVLLSQLETINTWTRNYCRLQISKHFKWCIINIIQQNSDSEKQQFTQSGKTILNRIKPSLDGIGNSRESVRDHYIVFGIFAPDRYAIEKYPDEYGYDISLMRDNFRSLIILKSNLSVSNIEIPLYFDGGCSLVRELPALGSPKLQQIYNSIRSKNNKNTIQSVLTSKTQ
jgi:hypothetical protein